jgi:hypothetical protein
VAGTTTAAAAAAAAAAAVAAAAAAVAAAAVAAAFSTMSLGSCSTADLSPWEVYTDDDDSRAGSEQQSPLHSSRQSRECSGSGGRASNASAASCRASPRQSQQQQQSPRYYQQHLRASDSSQEPTSPQLPHSVQQQQQQQRQQRPGLSPTSSTRQGLSYSYVRPSSAPVGGSRGAASSPQAAAGLAASHLTQQQQQARGANLGLTGNLGVVVESSQEGLGPASVWHQQEYVPGRHASPSAAGQRHFSAAAAAADFAGGMHSQQEMDEQRYQHHILAHIAQLQLQPRPASAEPWGRKPQWGRQHLQGTGQHQVQHRMVPSWDDSPMPLNIPRWVPIVQATLLPSASTACSSAAGTSAGTGLGAVNSILAGSRGLWPTAGGSREARRPQTAGPVMTNSHASSSHSWAALPQQQRQEHMGFLTARSVSSSANRRRAALLPSSTTAAAAGGGAAAGSSAAVEGAVGGIGGSRTSSGMLPGAKVQQHSGSSTGASTSFSTGYASAYLFDVQQKIRSANSYCKQLGLNTQYRLAQGSSRKDKWQLEQIEVEVWVLQLSSQQQATQQQLLQQQVLQQQQHESQQQHSSITSAAATDGCEWQHKRSISLAQFTHHLNRLRAGTAGAAAAGSSAPRVSAGSSMGSSFQLSAAAAAGAVPSHARPFSPDRVAASNRTASAAAAASAGRQRAASSGRAHSSGRAQLLVLSPRNSEGMDPVQQHLVRPASAPRGCSRLSPRRQRD